MIAVYYNNSVIVCVGIKNKQLIVIDGVTIISLYEKGTQRANLQKYPSDLKVSRINPSKIKNSPRKNYEKRSKATQKHSKISKHPKEKILKKTQ